MKLPCQKCGRTTCGKSNYISKDGQCYACGFINPPAVKPNGPAKCPKCDSDDRNMIGFDCFRGDETPHIWHKECPICGSIRRLQKEGYTCDSCRNVPEPDKWIREKAAQEDGADVRAGSADAGIAKPDGPAFVNQMIDNLRINVAADKKRRAAGHQISDEQLAAKLKHWHEMQNDPYYPSQVDDLYVLLELSARRIAEGWISVEDKLPEENQRVLIWMNQGKIDGWRSRFGEISCGHWRPEGGNGNFDDRVSHWRPLPAPPA